MVWQTFCGMELKHSLDYNNCLPHEVLHNNIEKCGVLCSEELLRAPCPFVNIATWGALKILEIVH